MKKILLLLFICFSNALIGQQYIADLNFNVKADFDGSYGDGCRNSIKVVLKFTDNSEITLLSEDLNWVGRTKYVNFSKKVNYPISKNVSEVIIYTSRNWNRTAGGCGGSGSFNNVPVANIVSFCKNYFNEYSDGKDDDDIARWWDVNFSLNFYAPIEIENVGIKDILPTDDNIEIIATRGYRSTDYYWQYSFDASEWENLPSFRGQSSLKISAIDVFPTLNENFFGQKIYFRQYSCNGEYKSNNVHYRIGKSAPHIISVNKSNTVSCFDSRDGSVKIKFDRALETDELLTVYLEHEESGHQYDVFNISSLDADNSYSIFNLPAGTYKLELQGSMPGYDGQTFNTYTDGAQHRSSFTINKPIPVEFSTEKLNDVWCHSGSDGQLRINANGGSGNYEYSINGSTWAAFSKGSSHLISGLPADTYAIQVRDSKGCIAKEVKRSSSGQILGLGDEIIQNITINEPDKPVLVEFVYHKEPTGFGFSDGRIRAKITGGTSFDGTPKYRYKWKHENGTLWTTFSEIVNSDGWFLTLENAIAGTYSLTIEDANHSIATHKEGCTVIDAEFTLKEPPLLTATISRTNPVSCNAENNFGDASDDGELVVMATGGVPFDPLIDGVYAYRYTWKKKSETGVYQVIPGIHSSVLKNCSSGAYAVHIEDANGIVLGTYQNNMLETETDALYTLEQPDLIEISLSKVDVFCHGGNDGAIDATITGGTGNYSIEWSTNATTEDITSLSAGTYSIYVTDEKGCQAEATCTISEPYDPIAVDYTAFFAPTFSGATNGWIEAVVSGGTPLDSGAYSYIWQDANGVQLNAQVTEKLTPDSYTIQLNAIGAGTYYLTIQDKNYPLASDAANCTLIETAYELYEPAPLAATIQMHRPISCNASNVYGNPYADGALKVLAEGGVHLQPSANHGLPYYYTWKKETAPGIWSVLTSQNTNIASGLDAGTYAVNIKDANGIVLGEYQNNVLVSTSDIAYVFEEPPLLELTIEKQDVYCFNGSDGWANAILKGGVPPYSMVWNNGTTSEKISNLSQGEYDITISDSRGCEVTGMVQINQPDNPLTISFTAFATPSSGGASDGWIVAEIRGGTNYDDGSYTYFWQDASGQILNTQTTTRTENDAYLIRLNDISKGSYFLSIEDAHFELATTKEGCTNVEDEFMLYDPIEAQISIHTPISCNQDNTFNNPFADGALQVEVQGGLPFSDGQPYVYTWKKKNPTGGYDDMNQNSNVLTGLLDGTYALNVQDSRGIQMGMYSGLELLELKDEYFEFKEPESLEVSLSATQISCDSGNDGTAEVHVTGGIPPYKIEWSNGQVGNLATQLIGGNYLVYIRDARGCQATGQITIDQPGGLKIDVLKHKNPSCFQGADGSIALALSGGTPPYNYSWNTGMHGTELSNLEEGVYTFSLEDANGCRAYKAIELVHPEEIQLDLGPDRTLCKDQTLDLDARISDPNSSYSWTSNNGFSSDQAQITVSTPGTYTVTATSSLGCTVSDSIVITYTNIEIDAEFLLSSQTYVNQDVVVFNVSSPLGQTNQWIIPDDVLLISEHETSVVLRFTKAKTYTIGFRTTQGNCYQDSFKTIVVEDQSRLAGPSDTGTLFIEEFELNPNPNDGNFEAYIKLAEAAPIGLRVFTIQGSLMRDMANLPTSEEYTIPIQMHMPSGIYLVILETEQQTQVKRMIVN